jgi:ferredoxin
MIEVVIDRARCIGSGNCTFTLPEVFDMDDDGKAFLTDGGTRDLVQLRVVELACPGRAIEIREG